MESQRSMRLQSWPRRRCSSPSPSLPAPRLHGAPRASTRSLRSGKSSAMIAEQRRQLAVALRGRKLEHRFPEGEIVYVGAGTQEVLGDRGLRVGIRGIGEDRQIVSAALLYGPTVGGDGRANHVFAAE